MKFKKGAMFGLDARIALAIFGALSVISGAALYSAIEQATVIKYITQLEEVNKAYEAYRLDTGLDIPKKYEAKVDVGALVSDSGAAGWSGPYISLPVVDNSTSHVNIEYENDKKIYIDAWVEGPKDDWGWDETSPTAPNSCTDECYLYFSIHGLPTNIVNAIDEKIDGSVSPQTGKARRFGDSGIYVILNRYL